MNQLMKKPVQKFLIVPLAAATLMLAACAGQQTKPAELEALEGQVRALQDNPTTIRKAQVPLSDLEKLSQRAANEWNAGDDGEYEHTLELAKQQVAITEAKTKIGEKRAEVASLSEQRNKLRLDAQEARLEAARENLKKTQGRAAEAEAARALAQEEARAARAEIDQAKMEAQLAADQAMALSAELENVKAEQTDRGTLLTLQDILFEFGKAELKSGADRTMGKLADFINQNPKVNVVIEGFTDSVGSDEFNQKLSEKRANAVKTALSDGGVPDERMSTKGMGEQFPVASNDSDAGRSKNRRVEILLEQ